MHDFVISLFLFFIPPPSCAAGCKIKALRAKTNTYIKTPVRGEEPVFVITGRPEDVSAAQREILTAADHFTEIRASRKTSSSSLLSNGYGCQALDENKVTILVRVPYRVVGLVVGQKGATVKRIQQITSTYIVTPSREKEPCFKVTGSPENVERAKKEIESYIALRTGGSLTDSDCDSDYSNLLSPLAEVFSPNSRINNRRGSEAHKMFQFPTANTSMFGCGEPPNGGWVDRPLRSTPMSSAVFSASEADYLPSSSSLPPTYSMPMSAPITYSDRMFDFSEVYDALSLLKPQPSSPTGSCESNSSEGTSVVSPQPSPKLFHRTIITCCICREREVGATGFPCGHTPFCYTCARNFACTIGCCPLCSSQVSNMLQQPFHAQ